MCGAQCSVWADTCDVTCPPPPGACGDSCSDTAPCGAGLLYLERPDGAGTACLTQAAKDECTGCDGWCSFDAGCHAQCHPVDVPDPVDAGSYPDSSTADDVHTTPEPVCAACCQPCGDGMAPCCAGSSCGKNTRGEPVCVPSECEYCLDGCTFACP